MENKTNLGASFALCALTVLALSVGALQADDLNLTLRSGDGNVDVALDEQISVAFDLETRDGRIRVNSGAVSDLLKEKGRVTGKFGQGVGSIFISSVDGNITLRQ